MHKSHAFHFRYGPDRVEKFVADNNLKLIVRAHECVQGGYEYFAGGLLVTVFSASNYCNLFENDGAMLVLVRDEATGDIEEHVQVRIFANEFRSQIIQSGQSGNLNRSRQSLPPPPVTPPSPMPIAPQQKQHQQQPQSPIFPMFPQFLDKNRPPTLMTDPLFPQQQMQPLLPQNLFANNSQFVPR
jgi:hypothetical protein